MNIANPPLDGDSYEYAGLARNYLEYGDLRVTHVRGYDPADQTLPQPAWNRATLWTLIIIPFQKIFGSSFLSCVIPFAITLFLLAPVTYLFAARFFGPGVAFVSAVAVLLNPRILAWSIYEDPGQPDILIMILFMIGLHLVLNNRMLAAGIVSGLAVLTRLSGFIFLPLVTLWLALFDRKAFAKKGIYIYIAAVLVTSSPLFIRNYIVFQNPFYSDQGESSVANGAEAIKYMETKNVLDSNFTYKPRSSASSLKKGISISQRLRILLLNSKPFLFGNHNGLAWYPGFFELVTLLLTPFMFIGISSCFRDPRKSLMLMFTGAYLFGLIALKLGYEDRYIFPVIPFCMMFAFYGALQISKKIKWITPAALLAVFIAVEVFPAAVGSAIISIDGAREPRYSELNAVCRWVKNETPENAVMMTVPFWSPQYLCSRQTVPPAMGGLDTFKTIADKYSVDYFMFTEYWGGDRFPKLPFLEPVIRGKYITLYRLDRENPNYKSIDGGGFYMKDFDFLDYFWKGPLNTRIGFQPLFTLAEKFGAPAAWIIYFIVSVFLLRVSVFRSRSRRMIIYLGAASALFLAGISVLEAKGKNFNMQPPPVSRAQVEMLFSNMKHETDKSRIVVISEKESREAGDAISESTGITTECEKRIPENPHEGGTVIFIPVAEKSGYIKTDEDAADSSSELEEEKILYENAAGLLKRNGMDTEIVSGGVFGFSDYSAY